MVFKNFGQKLDHFGINRRPQDVKTMSSQRPGDVLPTNFWTSGNGHFAAWVVDWRPTVSTQIGTGDWANPLVHWFQRAITIAKPRLTLGPE